MNASDIISENQHINCFQSNITIPEICEPFQLIDWILIGLEVIVALITVVGNGLVILSVFLVKSLRKPHNYLLLSLAAADLLVGAFVMPLSILLHILRQRWPLGTLICNVWITADITCCTASIFNLTAIALDRYIAITSPFFYKVHATLKTIIVVIFVTWLLPVLCVLPTMNMYTYEHHLKDDPTFEICKTTSDSWSHIIGIITACFIPLLILLFVYSKILCVLIKQKRKEPNWKQRSSTKATVALQIKSSEIFPPQNLPGEEENLENSETKDKEQAVPTTVLENMEAILREHKGSVMLGICVVAYLLSWLPCFMAMFVQSLANVLGIYSFSPSAWTFDRLLWLGYANSALNPFIYAMFIPEFRQSFKEIMLLRCCGMAARIRLENYKNQTRQPNPSSQINI